MAPPVMLPPDRVAEPVFHHSVSMAPLPSPPPQLPPRDVFVDRPVEVPVEMPFDMVIPTHVEHTFKSTVSVTDHDFPYHDATHGCGWRFHFPDNLDEQWTQTKVYKQTPFQELLHKRDEETWQDMWDNAYMGESHENGWYHRRPPFSRRVRDPEALLPENKDFFTELMS